MQSDHNDIYVEAEDTPVKPPPSFSEILKLFLKQVVVATGDLAQLTCPSILLSGISLLEYSCHWCDHPLLFAEITEGTTALGTVF